MQAREAAHLVAGFLASRGGSLPVPRITRRQWSSSSSAYTTRTLTMGAYLTVIGTALGLVAMWAALATLVA
jgi:hypothetical protein